MSSTKTKSTPSFYELIKDYPRDGIRLGEAAGIVKKGLLEEIIIYEEFLFLRDSEPQLKKGDIYDRLAWRYGFSVSSIRKKSRPRNITTWNTFSFTSISRRNINNLFFKMNSRCKMRPLKNKIEWLTKCDCMSFARSTSRWTGWRRRLLILFLINSLQTTGPRFTPVRLTRREFLVVHFCKSQKNALFCTFFAFFSYFIW